MTTYNPIGDALAAETTTWTHLIRGSNAWGLGNDRKEAYRNWRRNAYYVKGRAKEGRDYEHSSWDRPVKVVVDGMGSVYWDDADAVFTTHTES